MGVFLAKRHKAFVSKSPVYKNVSFMKEFKVGRF
jgi:hypothetical protein